MGKYQFKLLMLFNLAFLMKCKYYSITAKYNTFMFDNSVLVRTFSTGLQGFNGEVYLRHLKIFTVVCFPNGRRFENLQFLANTYCLVSAKCPIRLG